MSTSSRLPIGELHAVLDEIGAVDPIYLTTTEKRSASLGLAKAEARLQAARLRLLATSDDIAEATGDRSTASWLANATRDAHGTLRRDAALARALESRWTQTAAASAATTLSIRPRGDGTTDIHARVPDQAAGRLSAYLNAYTAPRRRHLRDTVGDLVETPFGPLAPAEPAEPDEVAQVARLPIGRQRGIAFVALLENIPTTQLPRHGGTATSVMVTLDYDTLVSGVGVATTSTGERVTAGQARRLACQGCTEVGCSMPAEFCEAHHTKPWSQGGKTSLKDGKLLCPFHHHRAHDPAWITHHHPNGTTSFTRRH